MNIFILAKVANISNNLWIAQRTGFLAVANDYVDGMRERGVLLPTIIWMARNEFSCQCSRVWMAQTCGSLSSTNIPNEYGDSVAIARTWDNILLQTFATLREWTRVHLPGAHYTIAWTDASSCALGFLANVCFGNYVDNHNNVRRANVYIYTNLLGYSAIKPRTHKILHSKHRTKQHKIQHFIHQTNSMQQTAKQIQTLTLK